MGRTTFGDAAAAAGRKAAPQHDEIDRGAVGRVAVGGQAEPITALK